jgi:hypothetical protein
MQSTDFNERDKYNNFPLLVNVITNHLEFAKWGFETQIFRSGTRESDGTASTILFQSQSCKFEIVTFRDRPSDQPEIYFFYGRLHAPDTETVMLWNGKECHCWHNHLFLYVVLGFLDGLSPKELTTKEFAYQPDVMTNFERDASADWSKHEYFAREHNTIWNHYGQRLFDVFDVRKPALWNQFTDYYQSFRSEAKGFEMCYEPDVC